MSKSNLPCRPAPRNQQGAALVTGLVLLGVITVMAVTGLQMSTQEVQMAGNTQSRENAFQAAEVGIDLAMTGGGFDTLVPVVVPATATPDGSTYETTTGYNCATAVPTGGYSMGLETGFNAYHFRTQATGRSARGARSIHSQDFFVVGPGGTADPCL